MPTSRPPNVRALSGYAHQEPSSLPRAISLAGLDQDDLDLVAASLNNRPRKTLDYATPSEAFNAILANLAGGSETPNSAVRYEV